MQSVTLITLLLASSTSAFAPQSKVNLNVNANSKITPQTGTSLAGIGSVVTRVRDSITSKERSREDLKIGIAGFYDRSSQLWENGKFNFYHYMHLHVYIHILLVIDMQTYILTYMICMS